MNKFKLMSLLVAALFLGGCADLKELTGGPEAPIEERGAVATTSAEAGAAAASSSGGAGNAGKAAGQGQPGASSTGAGTGAGTGQMVETHALPARGTGEAMAMDSTSQTAAASATAASTGATTAIVGVPPEQAVKLSDPENVLSKRVIQFDFDSDAIREEFRGLIEAHAGFLKTNAAARIILQGHTDERGSRDYNLALGQRRADSVKQALSLMGVQDDQVETVSLGEEKPVQEGHDESVWRLNRRAEIHYLGE